MLDRNANSVMWDFQWRGGENWQCDTDCAHSLSETNVTAHHSINFKTYREDGGRRTEDIVGDIDG